MASCLKGSGGGGCDTPECSIGVGLLHWCFHHDGATGELEMHVHGRQVSIIFVAGKNRCASKLDTSLSFEWQLCVSCHNHAGSQGGRPLEGRRV